MAFIAGQMDITAAGAGGGSPGLVLAGSVDFSLDAYLDLNRQGGV